MKRRTFLKTAGVAGILAAGGNAPALFVKNGKYTGTVTTSLVSGSRAKTRPTPERSF